MPEGVTEWMMAVMQSVTGNLVSFAAAQAPREDPEFEYSGQPSEDPVAFFAKFEKWVEDHRTPEERYHRLFRHCLKGEAYSWYREVQDQDWPLVKALFLQRFNSMGTVSGLWRQLFGVSQKPGEWVGPFIMAKWGLFKRLTPATPERERIAIICELLNPTIKAYLRGKTFTSLQELIEISSQIEGDIKEQTRLSTPTPPRQEQREVARAPGYRPEAVRPGQQPHAPETPRAKQTLYPCRWCGGPHYNNNCPSRLPPRQPASTNQIRRGEPNTAQQQGRPTTQEQGNQGNGQRAARTAPNNQA